MIELELIGPFRKVVFQRDTECIRTTFAYSRREIYPPDAVNASRRRGLALFQAEHPELDYLGQQKFESVACQNSSRNEVVVEFHVWTYRKMERITK